MSIKDHDRLARAVALIDAANAGDPNTMMLNGALRPKEVAHAEMLSAWMARLRPQAAEALLLAARAHHIRRWERPRAAYPEGRGGYLRWRIDAERFHADIAARLLERAGYDASTVARTSEIIRKEGLGRDSDVQALEDGLCLVFLETQLDEVAGRLDREKMLGILRRTWKKMSPEARELALTLTFGEDERSLIREALG